MIREERIEPRFYRNNPLLNRININPAKFIPDLYVALARRAENATEETRVSRYRAIAERDTGSLMYPSRAFAHSLRAQINELLLG